MYVRLRWLVLYALFIYNKRIDNVLIILCINTYGTIKIISTLYKGRKYLLNIFWILFTSSTTDYYITNTLSNK